VWNLVCNIKEGALFESAWDEDAEENIWT